MTVELAVVMRWFWWRGMKKMARTMVKKADCNSE